MPYKIVELNEDELKTYKGKIIQVIDSYQGEIITGRDYLGCSVKKWMWKLVCLVEEE